MTSSVREIFLAFYDFLNEVDEEVPLSSSYIAEGIFKKIEEGSIKFQSAKYQKECGKEKITSRLRSMLSNLINETQTYYYSPEIFEGRKLKISGSNRNFLNYIALKKWGVDWDNFEGVNKVKNEKIQKQSEKIHRLLDDLSISEMGTLCYASQVLSKEDIDGIKSILNERNQK